ncbi:zona pellucida sperm-binding protein 3 [Nematolebias whitei]|uniref:zona pellucida sperm-binding protein 3 n=1 Tax=Nematolebias whitei TaxID=451745 RepID=UPI0018970969|nr:zona pellucida sperm-binding protein 3 [Nematolebias whitei]
MPPLPLYFLFSLLLFDPVQGSPPKSDGVLPATDDERALVVKCRQGSVEVEMRAHLLDPGLSGRLVVLRLGPDGAGGGPCSAGPSSGEPLSIRAPLSGCGSRALFTEREVLYVNKLLLSFTPAGGGSDQVEAVALPVLCRHSRRYTVSSGALRPTWTPHVSVHSSRLSLDFTLRLMTDDWTDKRSSPVYFMDQTVNMEASLDLRHPPLRLFAGSCVATLTPDGNSRPRYPFIDHQGCFTDSLLSGSGSRFLPRVRDQILQIQLQPFLFHQDHRRTIYITCHLEAVPVSKADPEKKACSFINGSWRSVDGGGVCESCSSTKSSQQRVRRSQRSHTGLRRKTTLGPIIFIPEQSNASEGLYRGR